MLHKLHRLSALVIGSFILCHLANHLFILAGVQQHIEVMNNLRLVYRNILLESLLILCIIFQLGSGLSFAWQRRGQRKAWIDKAQVISGLYLAFFFINHIAAVFYGRWIAQLDTNIYYGIAGFHIDPLQYFFMPYYGLAIVAIFVHIAAAAHWLSRQRFTLKQRHVLSYCLIGAGITLAIILLLAFSGTFTEINIPADYQATYQ